MNKNIMLIAVIKMGISKITSTTALLTAIIMQLPTIVMTKIVINLIRIAIILG